MPEQPVAVNVEIPDAAGKSSRPITVEVKRGDEVLHTEELDRPGPVEFMLDEDLTDDDHLTVRASDGGDLDESVIYTRADFLGEGGEPIVPVLALLRPSNLVAQLDEKPHAFALEPRVGPKQVGDKPPVVAGMPATGPIPVNPAVHRYVSVHISTCSDEPLQMPSPGEPWGKGKLQEFETMWEPIGWALDEWIDTDGIAPYELSLRSDADVHTRGNATALSDGVTTAVVNDSQHSRASTDEAMALATSSMGTSHGVNLGIGGSRGDTSNIVIDPIAALTSAVTGMFQLGYSNSSEQESTDLRGKLTREVGSNLSRATSQQQRESASALSDSAGVLRDRRAMRAIQSNDKRTGNLAVFSVVRQWLVSTVASRSRPVVLIPIADWNKRFTAAEVFENRVVLDGALLDPTLREALDETAREYVPAPQDAVAPITPVVVDDIEGTIRFSETAIRHGSSVEVGVTFRDLDDGESTSSVPWRQDDIARQRFAIPANGELWSHYVSTGLSLIRDGALEHQTCTVDVWIAARLSDGRTVTLVDRRGVALNKDRPRRVFPRQDMPDGPAAPAIAAPNMDSPQTRRLLAHLDDNRYFYRLAIDLQLDTITRFVKLWERHSEGDAMPIDMRPRGIAGIHIAFLAKDDEKADAVLPVDEPIRQILSTPAGGTYLELIPGQQAFDPPAEEHWPQIPSTKDGLVQWPTPFQPAMPAVTLKQASTPAVPGAGATPTAGASELSTLATSLLGDLDKVRTSLASIAKAAQGAVPASATAPAATDPKAKTDDSAAEGSNTGADSSAGNKT